MFAFNTFNPNCFSSSLTSLIMVSLNFNLLLNISSIFNNPADERTSPSIIDSITLSLSYLAEFAKYLA